MNPPFPPRWNSWPYKEAREAHGGNARGGCAKSCPSYHLSFRVFSYEPNCTVAPNFLRVNGLNVVAGHIEGIDRVETCF